MNLRLPLVFSLLLSCVPVQAEEGKVKAERTTHPGLIKRIGTALWPFGKKPEGTVAEPPPKGSEIGKQWKGLEPSISVEPLPLKLSEVRTMDVKLRLTNRGKKLAQLDFPTTQRIEVLVKDAAGNRVELWSEDQAFQNEATLVAINPSERLEYTARVATRDLQAGQPYTIEAFFPNYDNLRAVKQVIPLP